MGYQKTTVSVTGDPQHYVARGRVITLTKENATFDIQMWNGGGYLYVSMTTTDSRTNWAFRVASPHNGTAPIVPGIYETAQDPLSAAEIFDFYGDGNGCNQATARLIIHSIDFDPVTLKLRNFRGSFSNHHCEGSSPVMQGEIAILEDVTR
jgi:hypothetical protein